MFSEMLKGREMHPVKLIVATNTSTLEKAIYCGYYYFKAQLGPLSLAANSSTLEQTHGGYRYFNTRKAHCDYQ